jgi:hypothetical protein
VPVGSELSQRISESFPASTGCIHSAELHPGPDDSISLGLVMSVNPQHLRISPLSSSVDSQSPAKNPSGPAWVLRLPPHVAPRTLHRITRRRCVARACRTQPSFRGGAGGMEMLLARNQKMSTSQDTGISDVSP